MPYLKDMWLALRDLLIILSVSITGMALYLVWGAFQ